MAPINPNANGRFLSGSVYDRITTDPENSPAVPIPAMARPTINASDVGASAHSSDPTSKMKTAVRYVHLTLNMRYSEPYVGCSAVVLSR